MWWKFSCTLLMGIKAVSKEIVETNEEIRIFVFFFSCCIFNLLRINLRKKFRVWLSTYEFCEASRSEKKTTMESHWGISSLQRPKKKIDWVPLNRFFDGARQNPAHRNFRGPWDLKVFAFGWEKIHSSRPPNFEISFLGAFFDLVRLWESFVARVKVF